ncbi:host-nuclease inhibitor Gam family protein [Accumulibacter sp.]|uniref:host-nuclease inhibitor Gam family protein n=1 Tax=Accumulibacter sp. TaxID=2053492 RepID=UPI002879A2E0|nr:host-nuclease inhibitor Gam family protein [Accumulibacter sp.]MDS4056461.1 host-nuclease inhibitor Gam family protein [Accumulibacter sp.]HMW56399.1 host-nuclease inhibitor Gam family protein [Accumulibacter sp.]HMW79171.1 host-nuclease inhibitor Gam family protein [Accumulibacter sp.]HNC66180.1 host-nuclease inhibitor Gam family protein [Thauera aminoaromatica]
MSTEPNASAGGSPGSARRPEGRRNRRKAEAAEGVPQTRDAAAEAIAQIGLAERQLARIEANMNDALAVVKEAHESEAEPLRKAIRQLSGAVQMWAEAHRDDLTQQGRTKTVSLSTGDIAWRTRPPSVRVTGADAVINVLRRLGLGRFVRVREEVNKEAILNEPGALSAVPGIAICQGEDFIITPFSTDLSEVA